jgi:hypothetical protein
MAPGNGSMVLKFAFLDSDHDQQVSEDEYVTARPGKGHRHRHGHRGGHGRDSGSADSTDTTDSTDATTDDTADTTSTSDAGDFGPGHHGPGARRFSASPAAFAPRIRGAPERFL